MTSMERKFEVVEKSLVELGQNSVIEEIPRRKMSHQYADSIEELKDTEGYEDISNCKFIGKLDFKNWKAFFEKNSTFNELNSMEKQINNRVDCLLGVSDTLQAFIAEIMMTLKRIFFKTVMGAREILRKTGIFQLRVQKKASSKATFLKKMHERIVEDASVTRVLRNFESTYEASQIEIERRIRFDWSMVYMIKTMAGLMDYENGLRASFLEKHVDLLPDTFCPFLMNRLSEDILK